MRLNHKPIYFQQPGYTIQNQVQFQGKNTDGAKNKLKKATQSVKTRTSNASKSPVTKAAASSAVVSGVATLILSGGALAPAFIMAGVGAGLTVGLNKARTSNVVPKTKTNVKNFFGKFKKD